MLNTTTSSGKFKSNKTIQIVKNLTNVRLSVSCQHETKESTEPQRDPLRASHNNFKRILQVVFGILLYIPFHETCYVCYSFIRMIRI